MKPRISCYQSGSNYRELAGQIRRVAQLARFPFARKELIRLAESFEYRARHLGRYEG
jgi:hypothetical protein